jgi:hypothetical protein
MGKLRSHAIVDISSLSADSILILASKAPVRRLDRILD